MILAQTDAFQSYASKGHGHPHVPEPAAYGFVLLGALLALVLWRRMRIKTPQKPESAGSSDANIFQRGFVVPFNCPLGVVHEVYSVSPCGEWGGVTLDPITEKVTSSEIKGAMYSIRAEIEVLVGDRANQDWAEFAEDPMGYLKRNPHVKTKRVIDNTWVTDEDLIESGVE